MRVVRASKAAFASSLQWTTKATSPTPKCSKVWVTDWMKPRSKQHGTYVSPLRCTARRPSLRPSSSPCASFLEHETTYEYRHRLGGLAGELPRHVGRPICACCT